MGGEEKRPRETGRPQREFEPREGAFFATRLRRQGLIAPLARGTLVTISMALIALATVLYKFALLINGSSLARQGDGPWGVPSAGISIGVQLIVMLCAANLARSAPAGVGVLFLPRSRVDCSKRGR